MKWSMTGINPGSFPLHPLLLDQQFTCRDFSLSRFIGLDKGEFTKTCTCACCAESDLDNYHGYNMVTYHIHM